MSYLCYRANIDMNHHQRPQTGAFQFELEQQIYFFRLSYLPSLQDIHLVLRLLNHQNFVDLDHLTYDKNMKEKFRKLLKKEGGMIVVCGPTGSGKSTTLHAFLNEIQESQQKSLITIEDPIEIYHKDIVQIQMNEALGLGYEVILKQVLRHDPDVVMIGEIRDEKSAAIALRLALTGHLVLTTLHAYSVKTALTRLENLGLAMDDLKEVLKAIISQRLLYLPEPMVFFEMAVGFSLKKLLDNGQVTYPSMVEVLLEAKSKGLVNDEQIEGYLD